MLIGLRNDELLPGLYELIDSLKAAIARLVMEPISRDDDQIDWTYERFVEHMLDPYWDIPLLPEPLGKLRHALAHAIQARDAVDGNLLGAMSLKTFSHVLYAMAVVEALASDLWSHHDTNRHFPWIALP